MSCCISKTSPPSETIHQSNGQNPGVIAGGVGLIGMVVTAVIACPITYHNAKQHCYSQLSHGNCSHEAWSEAAITALLVLGWGSLATLGLVCAGGLFGPCLQELYYKCRGRNVTIITTGSTSCDTGGYAPLV